MSTQAWPTEQELRVWTRVLGDLQEGWAAHPATFLVASRRGRRLGAEARRPDPPCPSGNEAGLPHPVGD